MAGEKHYTTNLKNPVSGLDDRDPLAIEDGFMSDARNVRTNRERVDRGPGADVYAEAPNGGAGSGVRVGTFQAPSSAGARVVNHGLGATPVALYVWTYGATSIVPGQTLTSDLRATRGFTDGTTSASANILIYGAKIGSASVPDTTSNFSTVLIDQSFGGSSPQTPLVGAFVSWTSSTFTINFTSVPSSIQPPYFGFMVIGGGAVTAKVIPWTVASTGAKAVTGAGFEPDVVMHIGCMADPLSTATQNPARLMYGAMSPTGQWAIGLDVFTVAPSGPWIASRCFRATRAIYGHQTFGGSPITGTPRTEASFTSMDADGFTLNFTAVDTSPADAFASLCLGGLVSWAVGATIMPAQAAPVTQTVTAYSGQAQGIMLESTFSSPGVVSTTDVEVSTGAYDGASFAVGMMSVQSEHGNRHSQALTTYSIVRIPATNLTGLTNEAARMNSMPPNDILLDWYVLDGNEGWTYAYVALAALAVAQGLPRNYAQFYPLPATAGETLLEFTDRTVFTNQVGGAGLITWSTTAEAYSQDLVPRWAIASTQDVIAWTRLGVNIRSYDGAAFGGLISTGTNHSALGLIAFNDRLISIYTQIAGAQNPTQIRWCVNGDVTDWGGLGSGVLLIQETSNAPLTGGFVLGQRAWLTKNREIVELIATGTLSPVHRQETRIPNTGCIAPHSIATAEFSAYLLGPDDVYEFDGSQMRSTGFRIYKTILQAIDYNTALNDIQGVIRYGDSEYWLKIADTVFIYDFRRDRWFRDSYQNVAALGIFRVGGIITLDVDESSFVVGGMNDGRTARFDVTVPTFLGQSIDTYFVTREINAQEVTASQGGVYIIATMELSNVAWDFRFKGTPDSGYEVGLSYDRGVSWVTQNVTTTPRGVGVAYFEEPYDQVRFRVRKITNTDPFNVYGPLSFNWNTTGEIIPPEGGTTDV